jgi:predicted DNA-binding transcriptional regulator AlpA
MTHDDDTPPTPPRPTKAKTVKLQDTLSYPPRGMNVDRAAAYVGLSKSKFLDMVDANEAPQPLDLGGLARWDRRTLDDWFDSLSGYVRKAHRLPTFEEVLAQQRREKQGR